MSRQVTCITKRGSHYDPHERIQGIGGPGGGVGAVSLLLGGRWWRAEDDAINDVLRDPSSYYVSEGDHTVWVIVSERNGRKFLTTQRDGVTCDNLLHLPECPR
jgi:Protein of unknown function (DUF3892)